MRMAFHGIRYEFPATGEGYKQRHELDAAITLAQPERHTHTYENGGVLYLSVWLPLGDEAYDEPYIAPAVARNYPSTIHGRPAERLAYERMLYDDTYVPDTMPLHQAVHEISKLEFSDEHKRKVRELLDERLRAREQTRKTPIFRKSDVHTPWYGWLLLLAIIGLIVWSQMPEKPPTPQELKKQEMKDLSDALRKCEGVSEKLQSECKEIELEKQQ
jgi:hypothetical protein